jgi:16S rRNA (cytosine967-C5)-methyltransferase
MISARTLAYQILLQLGARTSYPDRLLRSVLRRHSRLDDRDRALLTELVYGVLRWQGRLDWHIDQVSRIKPSKIDGAIRTLLRLALYQILFLDKVPHHAAVHGAVEIAKAAHPRHVVGFVNGVLREAIRRQGQWQWPTEDLDPARYLALWWSHPEWFVRRCLADLGREETLRLCETNNEVAPMVLRVNSLKTTPGEVLAAIEGTGVGIRPSPYLEGAFRIVGLRQDIALADWYRQGWVQVQDEASQFIALLVAPQPGDRVLDLCAGFGGKSTHLAALMGNVGEVVAVDHLGWKLAELLDNATRQGISVIRVETADVLDLDTELLGLFDRVLLDAPCSGFGSLRRNPDIKWRRHVKDPLRFARIQAELIERAASWVRPGGALIYSTCTIFREENEEVAERFWAQHPDWKLESAAEFLPASCVGLVEGPYLRTWPHRHGVDGFFAARWRRGTHSETGS